MCQKRRSLPIKTLLILIPCTTICYCIGNVSVRLLKTNLAHALCDAAENGNVDLIKAYLQQGADPNEFGAIYYARKGGHPEVIPLLKQAGVKDNLW
jgi:hypothetical protein